MTAPTQKYKRWYKGNWANSLPESYYVAMEAAVEDMTKGWFKAPELESGFAQYSKDRYVYGRMEQMHTQIVPWILETIRDPAELSVMEVGCGTGPSTVPLALVSKHIHAFDLAADAIALAKLRCEIMGVQNVSLSTQETSWIDVYANNPSEIAPPVDVVFCYALFEHLLPLERIKLLRGAWSHLPVGGYLVIVETPNRLYWYDWHTWQMPFADQLPEEIAYLWHAFSSRGGVATDVIARSLAEAENGNFGRLYRMGRGASFHEFVVALGTDAFEVVNVTLPNRSSLQGYDDVAIKELERQLALVQPAVHPHFARPCLDLILRKTGPARL